MYLAGIKYDNIWINKGILDISKTNPDNINAGKKAVIMEIWEAKNWFLAAEEISNPVPNAVNKNVLEIIVRAKIEPLNGTP